MRSLTNGLPPAGMSAAGGSGRAAPKEEVRVWPPIATSCAAQRNDAMGQDGTQANTALALRKTSNERRMRVYGGS